jgi:hypothetical protein
VPGDALAIPREGIPRRVRLGDRPHSECGLLALVILVERSIAIAALSPAPHLGGENTNYVSLAQALLTTGSYVESFDPAALPHAKYPPVFPALLALWIAFGRRASRISPGQPDCRSRARPGSRVVDGGRRSALQRSSWEFEPCPAEYVAPHARDIEQAPSRGTIAILAAISDDAPTSDRRE